MGQVSQMEADRAQGGLSSAEQLLLTSVLDSIGMSHEDYAQEWSQRFATQVCAHSRTGGGHHNGWSGVRV